jgi:hypothetical protein
MWSKWTTRCRTNPKNYNKDKAKKAKERSIERAKQKNDDRNEEKREVINASILRGLCEDYNNNKFFLDSGANNHCIISDVGCVNIRLPNKDDIVYTASGESILNESIGNKLIKSDSGYEIVLISCIISDDFKFNFVSLSVTKLIFIFSIQKENLLYTIVYVRKVQ